MNEFEKTKTEFMDRYNELKEVEEQLDERLKEWRGWNALLECIEDHYKEE